VPSLPWSALFLVLSLVMIGLAGMHAVAPHVQFSDQIAAGVLVPLGILGIVVWAVALRFLMLGRKKH